MININKKIAFIMFHKYKYFLLVLVLILALINPTFFNIFYQNKTISKDIYFFIDVSKSMDVMDVKSNDDKFISRLNLAKNVISKYISFNPQNRYAISVFAGDVIDIVPLTNDIPILLEIIDSIDTNFISNQSTNFSRLLQHILNIQTGAKIIISDGEDLSKKYTVYLDKIKQPIYTLGVGSFEGGKIPIGFDVLGDIQYKKNSKGQFIVSKLVEDDLKKISSETGGFYQRLQNDNIDVLQNIVLKYDKLTLNYEKEQSFVGFLILTLIVILLMIFFMIDEYFHIQYKKFFRFKNIFLILFLFTLSACDNASYYYNKLGINEYNNSNFTGAINYFEKSLSYNKKNDIVKYNKANTLYKSNKFNEALKEYSNIKFEDKQYEKDRLYNLGNTLYKIGEKSKDPTKYWLNALQAYSGALSIDNTDLDAYKNYLFVLKKLKQKESDKKDKNGKGKGDKEKDKQGSNNDENDKEEGTPQQGINTGEFSLTDGEKEKIEQYLKQMKEKQIRSRQFFNRGDQKQNKNNYDSFLDDFFIDVNLFFQNDPFFNPDLKHGDDEY